jgi:hypothetical protein
MAGTTDTVKAILTPGEFVIRKEAVDMIGVPTLEKLNDMPEAGGHSEIDRLIGMATLKNMTGMYGGGMVNAKQYGHGGMVNKYEDGGQAMSNLKPVPDNNPGLAKLPEDVRNKMGYMQEGGLMGMMHGGEAKKEKKYGYQDGGEVQDLIKLLLPTAVMDDPNPEHSHMMGYEPQLARENEELRPRGDLALIHGGVKRAMKLKDGSYYTPPGLRRLVKEEGEEERGGFLKKLLGMQEGGSVQEDAMMQQYLQSIEAQQANPFVPFDQRPPSSGEVMSPIPAGMEQGDMMRVIRDEREVLDMQDAELLRQKAQNALTRIKLDSLVSGQGDLIEQSPDNNRFLYNDFNQPEMPPLDSIGMRDLREYFNSQLMQGRDSSDIQSGIEMDSPVFPRF